MILNVHFTFSSAYQYVRHFLCVKTISAHRSFLAATIDALRHLGIALDGDFGVTTHKSRVTMCLCACSGTKHTTQNNRGRRCRRFSTTRFFSTTSPFPSSSSGHRPYRHLRICFHTTYLTTAINVAFHCSISDFNGRFVCDSLLAPECVGTTLTRSEHIAMLGCVCRIINTNRTIRYSNRTNTSVIICTRDFIILSDIGCGTIGLLPGIIIS